MSKLKKLALIYGIIGYWSIATNAFAPPLVAAAVAIGSAVAAAAVAVVVVSAIVVGTLLLAQLLKPKQPSSLSMLTALEQQLNPNAFRTFCLGSGPVGNDVRFWEVYGSTGFDQIVAAATHTMTSLMDAFYVNGRLCTFSGDRVTGVAASGTSGTSDYTPASSTLNSAFTIDYILQGVTGTTVAGTTGAGALWTSADSMTGCAFYRIKWNYDQNKLPQGIPTNTVMIGKGAPVYDPRKDTTVGGSGSHRANDQTTWEYTPTDSNGIAIGRNNALQMLWYLLGWTITSPQTGQKILVCGRGVDPSDIDYTQFIAAANECETAQFYSDLSGNTGDSHNTNEAIIAAGAQGVLIDAGGLWGYYPAIDDTATIAVALADANVMSGVQWVPKTNIGNTYNSVGGSFVDPSNITVYQPQAYPTVTNSTYVTQDGGFSKRMSLDFQCIQSPSQAQVLARIALNKNRLTGQFSATFDYSILKATVYSCVTLSFAAFGWTSKLFRIQSMAINPMGGVDCVLQEEASAVYTGGTVNTYVAPQAAIANDPSSSFAPTQNQIFYQPLDPTTSQPVPYPGGSQVAGTYVVADGTIWGDTTAHLQKMMLNRMWQIQGSLLSILATGTVLIDTTSSGSLTIPANALPHIDIFLVGGSAGGSDKHGAGGAEIRIATNVSVTPGTTVVTWTLGARGGRYSLSASTVATVGGNSTVTGPISMQANSGSAPTTSAAGAGGTGGSGGTGFSGEAGDLGTTENGGAAGISASMTTLSGTYVGGARQTTLGANGNPPGGGGTGDPTLGSGTGGFGQGGRIVIVTRT